MDKKEFLKFLDEIFKPIDFIRKGNTWENENEVFIKIISLQKSKHGNAYYLNYGFIIKGLVLGNLEMHVFNRLSSFDDVVNQKIMDLLDMESFYTDAKRKRELKEIIDKYLINVIQNINSENDLVNALKKRPHLNDVPLITKRYLHIE